MIRVSNVTKRFAGRVALRNLSLEASNGSITGLLGANGAGKTTTLRMIAGLLRPDQGDIRVGDAFVSRDRVGARASLGALLDHIGLYHRLTVRENIEYFGRLRGLDRSLLSRNVDDIVSLIGLSALSGRTVSALSQGERMKVALGRALVHKPTHLLLDEPTNGLDVPTVRALRDLLKRLRDAGCSILLSSHVLAEIQAVCDRVVVIVHGTAIAAGSVEDICRRAGRSAFEDAFIDLIEPSGNLPC